MNGTDVETITKYFWNIRDLKIQDARCLIAIKCGPGSGLHDLKEQPICSRGWSLHNSKCKNSNYRKAICEYGIKRDTVYNLIKSKLIEF